MPLLPPPPMKRIRAVSAPVGRRVCIRTDDGLILRPWHEVPADYRPHLNEVVFEGVELPIDFDAPAPEEPDPKKVVDLKERKRKKYSG